jgi:hypothetical protein
MTKFWTRTRKYMAVLWLGTAAVEALVFEAARRTDNSWVLLLGAALLVVPLAATDRTLEWFGRAPRKRWKRHDVEAGLVAAPEPEAPAAARPPGPRNGGRS